ncbi:glycosyltransferase family 4 protein [Paraburkholderia tropica]|uniref:glycosyltransferase family 4 protein n=1 Tax=Paraburkholderia tropica TaxID=92647 RepID=UPI003D2BB90A
MPTGVDRVGLAYVYQYRKQARAVLSEWGFSKILSEQESHNAFDLLFRARRSTTSIRALLARSILTPSREKFSRAVLLHTSHNGMERLRYYRAMQHRNIRSVFMVHDLIPLTHAEFCRPGVEEAHRQRIHTALRHADGLIANSQDTLDALGREAHRAGLILPPTVVARLAPGVTSAANAPSPLEHPYFVMLGTVEPRKNHWLMLQVWRRLAETLGERTPRLVIVGRRGWECENVVDMLERCSPIGNAVIEEADCSDERLRSWLLHARALIFPSFVEGYGMPLVEALALGVPVLASDLGVFHEIAGDIPDYLDPLDGPGWLAHIRAYTESDSRERAAQLARLRGFRPPTWQEHFEHVDHFLDSLFE